MRKPEERIYRHTLKLLNVESHEVVFLDDIGMNLKAAEQLGMKTIKVSEDQLKTYLFSVTGQSALL